MTRYKKRNRRKHRRDKRDKSKKSPAGIPETEIYDIGPDEIKETIKDLMRAPGAVMWFVNESGEVKIKIKIEA